MNIKFFVFVIIFSLLSSSCKSENTSNVDTPKTKTELKKPISKPEINNRSLHEKEALLKERAQEKAKEKENSSAPNSREVLKIEKEIEKEIISPSVDKKDTKTPPISLSEPAVNPPSLNDSHEVSVEDLVDKNDIIQEKENLESDVKEIAKKVPLVAKPDHKIFGQLLEEHVTSNGKVNYKSIKDNVSTLDQYLQILEKTSLDDNWTKEEKLAFWINAYNAHTIKMIIDNYPVKSITDLHGGKPWDVKWISLNGQSLSLNNIENDIIRPQFKEPRIHFAVNCAAKSCPPILNDAYYASSLDRQLESQTKNFLQNKEYNSLNGDRGEVSKIFDWYGEDFGNVALYISKYTSQLSSDAVITFKAYDWSLNE